MKEYKNIKTLLLKQCVGICITWNKTIRHQKQHLNNEVYCGQEKEFLKN